MKSDYASDAHTHTHTLTIFNLQTTICIFASNVFVVVIFSNFHLLTVAKTRVC